MAIQVMIPKEGSIENCLLVKWNYKVGDKVNIGDLLCELETDKSAFDLESPGTGTILDIFKEDGSEVPVLTTVAIIGEPGEDYSGLLPEDKFKENIYEYKSKEAEPIDTVNVAAMENDKCEESEGNVLSSPRARRLSREKNVPLFMLKGSGPDGSIVEKDVVRWLSENQPLTPAAREISERLGIDAPSCGTGIGGRITSSDIEHVLDGNMYTDSKQLKSWNDYIEIQVKGVRKVTAERMLSSVLTTAQYTLTSDANAEKLLECRSRFKNSPPEMDMRDITINDILLYAVSRALANIKELNCHFIEDKILQFNDVNLAFAVDTPKGLLVPVIKKADKLSIKEISMEAGRLSALCKSGKIPAEDITGGTFTLSNLGALGINVFTPILNLPQVAILGVGGINLKPINIDGQVCFKNYIEFSLTLNHQVIDGALGARFLKLLSEYILNIDIILVQ